MIRQSRLSTDQYLEGILSQNRFILSRAITLIESQLAEDNALARQIISQIMPYTGKSIRIGITGVPGVGKSTFIESFGKLICAQNLKMAVLAVDPSSQKTSGSIMGDKTRMNELASEPLAYIRPSPAGNSLGGVSRKTRETLLLCEAAGYEIVLIETVGVGQSETLVADMTDFFLLLMLAGAGDELQGIKKGIMEMADLIAITKADSGNENKAKLARIDFANALHLFPASNSGWTPCALTCSATQKIGLDQIWQKILEHDQLTTANSWKEKNRKNQNIHWFRETIKQQLESHFFEQEHIKKQVFKQELAVSEGKIHAVSAAMELMEIYFGK